MPSSPSLKPQKPLHNFPLQDLKWSINQTSTSSHRFRKPADCSQKLLHLVSSPDSDGSDGSKAGNSLSSPNRKPELSEKKPVVSDSPAANSEKKTKICIRIKTKHIKSTVEPANAEGQHQHQHRHHPQRQHPQRQHQPMELDELEESIAKTWNLRPRKSFIKASRRNGGALKIAAAPEETKAQEPSRPESSRPRATNDAKMPEKKDKEKQKEKEKEKGKEKETETDKEKPKQKKPKKPKFSIPLTKMEIEEDIYALTGSKPSRKPKKRAKHVQKQLDYVFPGLWLSSITPDMYKVNDTPAKD